jgi:acetylornithine/succinyldiaminopimelate/putrescine aminotransferase
MSAFKMGEHTTTFSGSPLVSAAGCAALDVLVEEKLADKAASNGRYFKAQLEGLAQKYKMIKEVRGLGLMLGMELRLDVHGILLKTLNKGVLVVDAGRTVVRILPPLVITKPQIDRAITALDEALGEEENERASSTVPKLTYLASTAPQAKSRMQLTIRHRNEAYGLRRRHRLNR